MRSHHRLLSFDGDMTLWDFDAGMRAALDATRRLLIERQPQVAATLADIQPMVVVRDRLLADPSAAHLSFAAIRHRAFQTLLAEHDSPDDALAGAGVGAEQNAGDGARSRISRSYSRGHGRLTSCEGYHGAVATRARASTRS